MTKTNNEFLLNILKEEAWKDLSEDFEWTEALLEKYQNEVDWDEISSNRKIRWTVPMVQKFAKKLNWTDFSACVDGFATAVNIDLFREYWDWHALSDNSNVKFTYELLERFADCWDWCKIIDNRHYYDCVFDGRAMEFYNKFQERIPASKLQDSALWRKMVEEQRADIEGEIIS